jgi:parallel beta-helix repeat protein
LASKAQRKIKRGTKMTGRVNLKIRLVITFVWLFLSGVVAAAEKHVPNQYPTIQAAINAASDGDTILVANGTYYENITLKDGVQVRGAGADVTTIDGGRAGSVVTAIGVGPDTVLDGFTITNGGGSSGGGIYLEGGSPVIMNNVVTQNRLGYSGSSGGGIYAYFSSATITHNTISNNSAEDGGGIYVTNWPSSSGPMPDIEYNNIYGNNSFAGGGIYLQISSPTVRGNTIAANTASAGGGIAANHSSSLIANNIIVSNSAGKYGGGGIWATNNSSSVIVSNTVVDNTASGPGTGIAVDNQFSLNITNCIVWGNNLYNCTATYSDIEGGYTGEGNINTDPLFVDAAGGNLHLQHGSPCINAGNPNYVPGPYETDIDGDPRIIGLRIDMGADEVDTKLLVPTEYGTIQAAIDASVNGNTVIVAPGTYTGTGNRDIDFLGKAITVRSTDPNDPNIVAATIIDCQGTSSSPYRGFYFHSGENVGSVLNGLTITNGYATYGGGISCDGSSPTITNCTFSGNSAYNGCGMYNSSSSPTITNCTFNGNSASYSGGGMYNYRSSSSPTITNCTFSDNSALYGGGILNSDHSNPTLTNCAFSGNIASRSGGGMYNNNSSPAVTNCTFTGNSVSPGGDYYGGGGICNYTSSPTITNCTFSGNSSTDRGGGILNSSSSPTLTDCTFSGNSAYVGGGIYNDSGSPAVTNCSFSDNDASYSGGGMYNYSSSPTITNCTFTGNSASEEGGGMFSRSSSSPKITDCTFSGNSASYGGGVFNLNIGSNPTITNCTFSSNSATDGGGIFNSSGSSLALANCILWGNTATGMGAQIFNSSSSVAVSFSDVQGGYSGGGNINADPCFVNAAAGDLHLLPDSPCINAGKPSFVPKPGETDIDGEPRVMLGRVDMGADEFNPFEIDFIVVNKRRIGRTLFEYDCNVTLTNISSYSVSNVQLEIVKAPENMVIVDPAVTFGDIEIAPGESATSIDMCMFQVDRSEPTESAEIVWKSAYEMAGGSPGVQNTASGISFLNLGVAGDIIGNGKVDFEDLKVLADQWLQPPGTPSADIAPPLNGDNIVNFLDFAFLAQSWLKGSGE